ncbi:MAG: choice-of-anchor V domain-containing protein, partial [bacterium]
MMFSFTVFSKQIFVKRSLLIALALIATSFYSVQYVESHSGGETGSTDKGGANSGCSCHCSTSNAGTTVTIATASTVFLPNTTYTFTIKVTNATETNGGCNVACDNGTLTAGADGLRKSGSELTHNGAKALPATWTFTYKTPASGNDIIYAVGNAVNGDGGNNGGNCTDKWNFATQFNITVQTQARGLTMSTALLDFGSRRVGTSTTLTAKVNSIGPDAALTITSSALTTGTSYSTTPNTANRVIAIGSAEPESVTFTPTARGNVVDGLTLNTDATAVADQTKIISLIGKGINGEFTGNATVAFDRVRVGTTKTIVYTVNNSGDDTLFLAQPQFIGAAFTLGTPLTSTAIPPNGSATVAIKFSPNAKQQFQGSMTFAALNSVTVPTIA